MPRCAPRRLSAKVAWDLIQHVAYDARMDQAAAEAILQRLPLITEQQTRMLHAMWESGDAVIRQRAWQRGKRALKAQHGEQVYEKANGAVSRWIRDWASGRVGQPYEIYSSYLDQNRLEIRIAAAPPILDAILGSLVSEVFPTDELEELMAPWSLAMDDDAAGDEPTDDDPTDDPATGGDTHP
jgi:hypothetical protein